MSNRALLGKWLWFSFSSLTFFFFFYIIWRVKAPSWIAFFLGKNRIVGWIRENIDARQLEKDECGGG
jgi:hypothetical protein